jgi:hypothetical protein
MSCRRVSRAAAQIREGWMENILLNIRPAICPRQAMHATL